MGMQYEFDKQQAQEKFETEKRITQFKADQKIKDLTIEKEQNKNKIAYGTLGAIVIIGGISFFALRQKRRADKISSMQQASESEKKKLELEMRWFDSELKALRSQMNPHFIFNCMASIQSFMTQNDPASAAKFLSKFARLIRTTLENSMQTFTLLEAELKMLEDYMELEKLRFGNKFIFSIEVDENIDPEITEVPSMLIQPYLENAIIHGIGALKDKQGQLYISLKKENNILQCAITDNGVGRKKAQEIKKQNEISHKSLGMSILQERLELINAKGNINVQSNIIDLQDEQGNPSGTCVELRIPLQGCSYALHIYSKTRNNNP